MKKYISEFIGTFWLVLGGCGTAILAGPNVGNLGVSLAFGLSVLTGAYALGHISGAHFNPAVTLGLWSSGKFEGKKVTPYIISQILGAIFAAGVLYIIVTGKAGYSIGNFAANGYGENSPSGYGMWAAITTEFIMTFMFLIVILGATSLKANPGFAGLTIGLTLTLIHLISIPVTNTSVNPARSISQAIFAGSGALSQLWLFVLVPIVGAILAGLFYKGVFCCKKCEEDKKEDKKKDR